MEVWLVTSICSALAVYALTSLTINNGETRTAFSSAFGSFQFNNAPSGETSIISVSAKKYSFADPVRVFSVWEDIADIIFVAN